LLGGLDLLRDTDLRSRLADVQCPVLVLGGDSDPVVPAAAMQTLADGLPRAELKVLPGVGHLPLLSHPDEVLPLISGFLAARIEDPGNA